MDTTYLFFVLLGLLVLGFGITAWFLINLSRKFKFLLGGATDENDLQKNLLRRLARTETKLEEIEPRVKVVEEIAHISVQKVGFLRFNPFNDTGGDNSFVLTLLDRENSGVVITSLYLRDGMRLYAKRVEKRETKQPLSEEEKRVLEETIKK